MREARSGGGWVEEGGACIWTDGDDDVCDGERGGGSGEREGSADRACDREHGGIRSRWRAGGGRDRSAWRDLHWWEGSGAWVWEPGGDDWGAVRAEWLGW